jgi:hypothetical protein
MRSLALPFAVLLALLPPTACRAGEREDALALIDQAVKAHGGADALARVRTSKHINTGKLFVTGGKDVPFRGEWTISLPERSHLDVLVNERQKIVTVVNGENVWQVVGGQTVEPTKEVAAEIREEIYLLHLLTLLPLREAGYGLVPLGEVMVQDQPALTVRVSKQGHRDVILYFDRKSGLLVKAKRRAVEVGLPVDKEYFFGDYKDFAGVKLPATYAEQVNGKRLVETSVDWQFPPKIDDNLFNKP